MSFGPPAQTKPRECPRCNAAIPLPTLDRCPVCGADVRGPGDVGKALVEAMTDVLADPLGKRKHRD
ncbi:MAG: hypothetical protein HYV09_34535 [Deltaproteobacteria bacterium]|nr:hypothetical protein [Deltaproteobacteria bacterium]